MDCKSAGAAVQEYLDGEASDSTIEEMQEHLVKCPKCREYLLSMRMLMDGLDSLDLLEPEPGFAERVLSRTRKIAEREADVLGPNSISYGWLQVLLAWAKGAAVMACVVMAFGMFSMFAPAPQATARVFSTDPVAAITVVGKQVTVPSEVTVSGNITIVDGTITIAGTVKGDVRVIRGSIDKDSAARVLGNVISVDSPVAHAKEAFLGAWDWFMSVYNRAVRKLVGP